MNRREVLTSGAAVGLLGLSSGAIGSGLLDPVAAFAAEAPVFWNGEGRRPHAVITGANTGIGKSAAGTVCMLIFSLGMVSKVALDALVDLRSNHRYKTQDLNCIVER